MTQYITKLDLTRQSLLSTIEEAELTNIMENGMTIIFISSTDGFLKQASKESDVVTVISIGTGIINGKDIPDFPETEPLPGETLVLGAVQSGGDYAIRWVTVTGATPIIE